MEARWHGLIISADGEPERLGGKSIKIRALCYHRLAIMPKGMPG